MSKGIIQIMLANIFCMIISIITNFILPKYLSIEAYNIVKSYGLYIAYAGLLAIGYVDGIYLKYGGKELKKIDKEEISNNMYTYVVFQFIVCFAITLVGIVLNNIMLILFSIGALVMNFVGYLKIVYQATGNFKEYGVSLKFEKIITFLLNMILVFLLQVSNGYYYIGVQIIASIVTVIYLYFIFKKITNIKLNGKFSFNILITNIKNGFIFVIGGVTDILFTGLDRWFIKILMTVNDFAYYSFAVSLENIISVFTAPISLTFYNYFCQGLSNEKIKEIKNILLVWGCCVISLAFPAKFVIENFITKYIISIEVIFYLFAAQFFYLLIRSIYINIYKAKNMQKFYLTQICIMIFIAFITNCIFYKFNKNIISFAQATFLTSVIWFLWCELKEKEIRYTWKEYFLIIIILISFFILGRFINTIGGFFIFVFMVFVSILLFSRKTIIFILNFIIEKIKTIKKEFNENK